jgi:predicted ribosomally synthesized peptide with SipW-like signal peptide
MINLKRNTLMKLLGSFAVLGAAASITGLGTFATFTSSTSASQSIASGTVSIVLGAAGPANRLTVGASNLVAGDTVQRAADLINNGTGTSDNLGSIQLTTSASPSSLLDTDATNGLQMTIDRCSVAWTETGPPYTYTCSGTTTTVLATRAVIGANLALSNLSAVATGATDHLRTTLTLPAAAPNALQGQTSGISYTFVATQRTAASK